MVIELEMNDSIESWMGPAQCSKCSCFVDELRDNGERVPIGEIEQTPRTSGFDSQLGAPGSREFERQAGSFLSLAQVKHAVGRSGVKFDGEDQPDEPS